MLRRLTLSNYGLVESAEIDLADGATIFTGETGSGKTMLLGAIGFVLGERASADAVRRGASRATVTLAFDPDDVLRERLNADGFEFDSDEEATIVREMSDAGKSAVRINGRPATAGYVREIAGALAEIVGQHEAQRLLAATHHLELLDRYAKALDARDRVRVAHAQWMRGVRALADLEGNARQAQQRHDEASFAASEIEALALKPGEDDRLTERRRFLDNVERIASALRAAHDSLASDEGSAGACLGSAASLLGTIGDMSAELSAMAEHASALQSEAAELATSIARALDATEFDAAELEAINIRLDAIDKLRRKYAPTIPQLLEYAGEARRLVDDFEHRDERLIELTQARDRARDALVVAAAALTKVRRSAAARLSREVSAELPELALASGRFDVAFTALPDVGPDGAESVEFTFAANAGEPLRPLARVASGGELSRVLLALVVALAATRDHSALVFDEIDAGIGGATATAVGARLGRLSHDAQIVCVTHLAQLATWASRHYVLEKHETKNTTTISVRELRSDEERAAELARMLSGESHDVALAHARTLMKAAAR